MRDLDPTWSDLASQDFGPWIPEGFLQYRSAEIRRLVALREQQPPRCPTEVEVGSNRGCFILGLCRARPEVHFYGLELKKGLCELAARKLEREGLSNGQILNADARLALPVYFGEASLGALYFLFPDPWWKKRHAKRRLLDQDMLSLAYWLLIDRGFILVKTDVASYAREFEAVVRDDPRYELVGPEQMPRSEHWTLSTRERHCIEAGLPVHIVALRKR